MPRGDQTGPAGMGPMTGRAAGYCAGYSTPGYTRAMGRMPAGVPFRARLSGFSRNRFFGYGSGRGRGGSGRGRGRW